ITTTPIGDCLSTIPQALQELSLGQGESFLHGISREELKANPKFARQKTPLSMVFEQLAAELLIPIVFEGQVRGFISFGPKSSHQEYSAEDLRLLGTLTDQLALSLENGRLYQESVKAYQEAEATNKKLTEMDRVKKQF